MPDESVKHIHLFAHATRDKHGRLEYVGAAQDVTGLHAITDAIVNPIVVLTPDGTTLYANRVALKQSGLTPSEARNEGFFPRACHRVEARESGTRAGRVRRVDGTDWNPYLTVTIYCFVVTCSLSASK
jgi:PAS domain-containing protein